jgi:hypothetical protein
MEPVESYLLDGGEFDFISLVNSYAGLVNCQRTKGVITINDIKESLVIAGQNLDETQILAHVRLLLESWASPSLNAQGQLILKLTSDTLKHESNAIKTLVANVYAKSGPQEVTSTENFYWDAQKYLGSKYPGQVVEMTMQSSVSPSVVSLSGQQQQQQHMSTMSINGNGSGVGGEGGGGGDFFVPSGAYRKQPMSSSSAYLSHGGGNGGGGGGLGGLPLQQQHQQQIPTSTYLTSFVEKTEPIIKLLAQVRKVGMDILFPQVTHDKVSCYKPKQ